MLEKHVQAQTGLNAQLREIRKKRRYTLREASERSELRLGHISEIECGRSANLTLASLQKLARAYSIVICIAADRLEIFDLVVERESE